MRSRFVGAAAAADQLPRSDLPEIAVVGRSNCGKSSLINALSGSTKLARTSSTPGRTRQINFFELTWPDCPLFMLVDLPGYGFAKVSKKEQAGWGGLISDYIDRRPQLCAMIVLLDIRRAPEAEERDLLEWAAQRELEVIVVLTKADKLAKSRRFGAQQAARAALGLRRRPVAVSVSDAEAVDRLRRVIRREVSPDPEAHDG